jgi:predicted PurR-regulated permease PerM
MTGGDGRTTAQHDEAAARSATAAAQAVLAAQREAASASAEARLRFWSRMLLRLALLGLAGYVLWRTRTILATVVVSMVLASAIGALVRPLTRLRLPFLRLHPRTQRTAATVLVFVLLFVGLGWSVRMMVQPFQQEWANLQQNWPGYQKTLAGAADSLQERYAALPPELRARIEEALRGAEVPSPAAYVTGLLGTTVSWASHIIELILVPILAFYFALDARALRSELLFLVPRGRLRSTLAILDEGSSIMRDYIVAQFWLAVIAGVVVGGGLALLGMQYALILGIFAAVTRAIPVIGPLLGGVPIVALTFVYGAQTGQPYLWVTVLLAFTIMHLVESKIIMPKFLGHRLHLHAAVILIALLVGGEFFGLMGMFLAAPVAALARVLVMHFLVLPRRRAERAARDAALSEALAYDADGTPRLTVAPGGAAVGGGRVLRLERALRAQAAAEASSAGVAPNAPPGPTSRVTKTAEEERTA